MIQAQHSRYNTYRTSFRAKREGSETVSSVYKTVHHWKKQNRNAFDGFPPEELLEIIDKIRIPLEEKKFEGDTLTDREEIFLEFVETLTDRILNLVAPMPKEPKEVTKALQYAKRISKRK